MVIVSLKGGLGNQMFQYAAARRLAYRTGQEFKMDLSFLQNNRPQRNLTTRKYELSIFRALESLSTQEEVRQLNNVKNKLIQKAFPQWKSNPFVREKHFHFDPSILTLTGDRYMDGHWMSEKYFADIEAIIREDFEFKEAILEKGRFLQEAMTGSNAVAIQVRRGDYVRNPEVAKVHGHASQDYFRRAIEIIKSSVENPSFFIFSDEIDWCIENFNDLKPAHFVEKSLEGSDATISDYFQLLTLCKHFIISNSTFAWWGAWLSTSRNKKIIAPRNWFADSNIVTTDIYPQSWIRI